MDKTIPRQAWLRVLLGVLVTAACFFILIENVGFEAYENLLNEFTFTYAWFAFASLMFGYSFRVLRWSIMLTASGSNISWHKCIFPFFGSVALNNILPLRLGDVVRALIFPAGMGIDRSKSITILIFEKLIDLFILFASLAICIHVLKDMEVSIFPAEMALVLVLTAIFFLVFMFIFCSPIATLFQRISKQNSISEFSKLRKYILFLSDFFQTFSKMKQLNHLIVILLLSAILWAAETGLFYFLMLSFGLEASFLKAIFIMALSTLSTLVPATPGYFGSFHLAAYSAVMIIGGEKVVAGSYAFMAHLLLWLPLTLIGVIGMFLHPELFKINRLKNKI